MMRWLLNSSIGESQAEKDMLLFNRITTNSEYDLIKLALENGANPNCVCEGNLKPLHMAIHHNPLKSIDPKIVILLIKHGADINVIGFMWAIIKFPEIVDYIIINKIKLKSDDLLIAVQHNNIRLITYLINTTAIKDVAWYVGIGSIDAARLIYESKIPFDKNRALIVATECNNIPVVKYLIELGADVQCCNGLPTRAETRTILDDNAPWKPL